MFEQALIDPRRQDRSPWAFAASTAGQSLALGAAILFSLIQTDALPRAIFSPKAIVLSGPAPQPLPPETASARPAVATATASPFHPRPIFQPGVAPKTLPTTILSAPDAAGFPTSVGLTGGLGAGDGLPPGINDYVTRTPAPPPRSETPAQAKPAAPTARPIPVSQGVQQAKLIHQVKPVYPALARQARVSGTVRLVAIIGRDGAIRNLQLASGHPLLSAAALEAVRQWRYQPTLLNGEPVEVVTQIDVNFTLQ